MDRASVPSVSYISRILRSHGEKKEEEEKEAQEQNDSTNQNSSSPNREDENCPIKEGKSILEPLWNIPVRCKPIIRIIRYPNNSPPGGEHLLGWRILHHLIAN